jgi:hypothetical protein
MGCNLGQRAQRVSHRFAARRKDAQAASLLNSGMLAMQRRRRRRKPQPRRRRQATLGWTDHIIRTPRAFQTMLRHLGCRIWRLPQVACGDTQVEFCHAWGVGASFGTTGALLHEGNSRVLFAKANCYSK